MRHRISIRAFVRPSVRPLVRPSVRLSVRYASSNITQMNHRVARLRLLNHYAFLATVLIILIWYIRFILHELNRGHLLYGHPYVKSKDVLLLAPKRVYKLVINCFIIFVYFSEGEGRRNGVFHSMPNISMQNPPRRWLCLPTNPWWETSKIFLTIGIYTLSILRICLCLSIRLSINPSVRKGCIRSASASLSCT